MNDELTFSNKREKRDFYKQQRQTQQGISAFKGLVLKIGIGVAILIALLFVAFTSFKEATRPLIGEKFEEQPREHVATDSAYFDFNSNPPTSGPHFATTASWGVLPSETDDRYLLHNLEHGGVWISYNCDLLKKKSSLIFKEVYAQDASSTASTSAKPSLPDLQNTPECQDLTKKLTDILGSSARSKKLVLTYRPQNDKPIAVASWGWLLKLDNLDEDKIKQFIKDHVDKGPEFVPDM